MRIRVQLETTRLPVAYRMLFVSLIKEAVRKSDEELYRMLYEAERSQPKKYSFAVFLSNFTMKENVFELDCATMTVSSSDPRIAVAFINGFQNIDEFSYQEWKVSVKKIELLKEKTIASSIVKFTTLSPLLLEDKNKKPILITDENFEKEMNFVVNNQFFVQYGRKLHRPLKIKGHQMKKQVIQETNSGAEGKKLFFTGQKGSIILEGHQDDLRLIYQDGLLARKSQGWGSMEVVMNYGENCCK